MTEGQFTDLLRPHIGRIVEAGRAHPNGHTPGAKRDPDDPQPGEFTADDLPRFFQYFAPADDGTFPGQVHEYFGVSIPVFAAATGLRRRATPTGWVWARS
jgi:hypothetical protein